MEEIAAWNKPFQKPKPVKLDKTLVSETYDETDVFKTVDIKAVVRKWDNGERVGVKEDAHYWMLMQGIDESDEVELDMFEINFLARLMEFSGEVSYRRGIRGYIINYGVNEVELSLRIKDYGVFFRHYGECPDAVGPKAYIVNIQLTERAIDFLEARCG